MGVIRRAGRRQHFTVLDNGLLDDDRISFKAKGLLAYLLSNPGEWTTSETLADVGPDGREAIRTGLVELRRAGYLRFEERRDERGRIRRGALVVSGGES